MVSRRGFLASTALIALSPPKARSLGRLAAEAELDQFIRAKMERDHIPGVAACLCTVDGIKWAGTYGLADLERRTPMTIDSIQNICSISKTFTTTALMQIYEVGRFKLDDDVNDYLPFPVRNPKYPAAKITFRLLLTHQSSIRDGISYARHYACADRR